MLRFTVTLAVLVATLGTSTEVMAERRSPVRNFARQIGFRWGAGNHVRNPGPDSGYYSPWSETNTPDHQSPRDPNSIPQDQLNPGQGSYFDDPSIDEVPGIENSATRLFRQPPASGTRYQSGIQSQIRIEPESPASQIQSIDAIWQQNLQYNQRMQPYQVTGNAVPGRIPENHTPRSWNQNSAG